MEEVIRETLHLVKELTKKVDSLSTAFEENLEDMSNGVAEERKQVNLTLKNIADWLYYQRPNTKFSTPAYTESLRSDISLKAFHMIRKYHPSIQTINPEFVKKALYRKIQYLDDTKKDPGSWEKFKKNLPLSEYRIILPPVRENDAIGSSSSSHLHSSLRDDESPARRSFDPRDQRGSSSSSYPSFSVRDDEYASRRSSGSRDPYPYSSVRDDEHASRRSSDPRDQQGSSSSAYPNSIVRDGEYVGGRSSGPRDPYPYSSVRDDEYAGRRSSDPRDQRGASSSSYLSSSVRDDEYSSRRSRDQRGSSSASYSDAGVRDDEYTGRRSSDPRDHRSSWSSTPSPAPVHQEDPPPPTRCPDPTDHGRSSFPSSSSATTQLDGSTFRRSALDQGRGEVPQRNPGQQLQDDNNREHNAIDLDRDSISGTTNSRPVATRLFNDANRMSRPSAATSGPSSVDPVEVVTDEEDDVETEADGKRSASEWKRNRTPSSALHTGDFILQDTRKKTNKKRSSSAVRGIAASAEISDSTTPRPSKQKKRRTTTPTDNSQNTTTK